MDTDPVSIKESSRTNISRYQSYYGLVAIIAFEYYFLFSDIMYSIGSRLSFQIIIWSFLVIPCLIFLLCYRENKKSIHWTFLALVVLVIINSVLFWCIGWILAFSVGLSI